MKGSETPQGATQGVEIIGMIGVQPDTRASGATTGIIGGAVDPDYVRRFAHAHEEPVLIRYSSATPPSRRMALPLPGMWQRRRSACVS